jgi:hypothetical protein
MEWMTVGTVFCLGMICGFSLMTWLVERYDR